MRIAILGAGSIGCWIGGRLALAGYDVVLIGRASMGERLEQGFALVPFDGIAETVDADRFLFATGADGLSGADVVIVSVKASATADAARMIEAMSPDAPVLSFQNGIGPAEVLADRLESRVHAAVVVFNVRPNGASRFEQTTQGGVILDDAALSILGDAADAIDAVASDDMIGTRWSKLLLNLVNALNVLSGGPLRDLLLDRDWRTVLAACVSEGLAVMHAADIVPQRVGRVHPRIVPFVLRLPTPIFRIVAAGMIRIGPAARTSMTDDLQKGREPELDVLNGAIVEAGRTHGITTPVNETVISAVRTAFRNGASPALSGRTFLNGL